MLDATLIFDGTISAAGATAGVAITTTRVSTNVLDFGSARDVGAGDDLLVHVQVMAALTGGTSLQVVYQTSADNSTFVDVLLSPVIVAANLTTSARIFQVAVPKFQLNDVGVPNQYHRLNYVVVGTFGAGSVFAYVSASYDRNAFLPYGPGYVTNF